MSRNSEAQSHQTIHPNDYAEGRSEIQPVTPSGTALAGQPRSWPPKTQTRVKWSSPACFTAVVTVHFTLRPTASPCELREWTSSKAVSGTRRRSRRRRERPHPWTHGASRSREVAPASASTLTGPRACINEIDPACGKETVPKQERSKQ
jgi:hypothetical protein